MPCKIVGGTKVPGNEKSWERKFRGTKGPGNESSRKQKGPGTKGPGNESSLELSFPGLFVLGNFRFLGTTILYKALAMNADNYSNCQNLFRSRPSSVCFPKIN